MEKRNSVLVFIIEDNEWYGRLLAHHLEQRIQCTVRRFTTAQAALTQLHERPAVVTLDYSLPDATGEEVLTKLRERLPDVAVIVISAQEDISTAVALLQQGAHDYLTKDEHTLDRLRNSVSQVAEQVRLRRENEYLRQRLGTGGLSATPILGQHSSIQQLQALIAKAARTTVTVSISGETGTGKELVAQAIHQQSARATQPFVAINMAAIPHELLESELFGHEKGAFTGAVARRVGRLAEAHTGTLFLDEISDLNISLQAKLLRVLQERQLVPVGGSRPVGFDVRLVVATHRDLLTEVRAGRFREDLYYRLLGMPIMVPPLRERGDDILLLAEAFVRDFCTANNLPSRHFSGPTRRALLAHPFPGNVRELKAVVELAAVMAEGKTIGPQHLSLAPQLAQSAESLTLKFQTIAIMQRCLDEVQGDVAVAAARLGVGRSTLYRLLQTNELRLNE